MPDTSTATIFIGGSLPTDDAARTLLDALDRSGAGLDGDHAERPELASALIDASMRNVSVSFSRNEMPSGTFEGVNETCRALSLPYVHQWDACPGCWDAGVEGWRVGDVSPVGANAAEGSIPCASLHAINAAHVQGHSAVAALIRELERCEVENLPALTLGHGAKAWLEAEAGSAS